MYVMWVWDEQPKLAASIFVLEQQTRRKLDAVKAGPLESGVSAKERRGRYFVKWNARKLRKRNRRGEYYVGIQQMKDKISNKRRRSRSVAHLIEMRGLACYG